MENIGPQAASPGKLACDALSQQQALYETDDDIAEEKDQMKFMYTLSSNCIKPLPA